MDDTTRQPRPVCPGPHARESATPLERALTYRRYPAIEILATAVLAATLIASAWEAFGNVVGFAVRIGLLSDVPPLEGWWTGDPARFWRFPVAVLTANAAVAALWWYHIRAARRGAAAFAVLGGLGMWALLGAAGGYFALALLVVAGWWVLPDQSSGQAGTWRAALPRLTAAGTRTINVYGAVSSGAGGDLSRCEWAPRRSTAAAPSGSPRCAGRSEGRTVLSEAALTALASGGYD
ncbi:MAG: hypothetical protein OXS29_11645 [bacterium]|nr:hypothetical protein [bacterium]MDE0288500.1 hypothetical protein [bacterium]MDE0439251.1 hypothetical protein [bacterium]